MTDTPSLRALPDAALETLLTQAEADAAQAKLTWAESMTLADRIRRELERRRWPKRERERYL